MTTHHPRTGNRRSESSYARIEDDIRRKIRLGVWELGAKIPSRLTLTKQYDVDLRTVQKAVGHLLDEGVLKSDGTLGTYVAKLLGDAEFGEDQLWSAIAVPERNTITRKVQGDTAQTIDVGLIGLIATDDPNKYSGYVVAQAVEHALVESGRVQLHCYDVFDGTDIPAKPLMEGFETLLSEGAKAICVMHYDALENVDALMTRATEAGVRLVFISDVSLPRPVPHVYVDHRYDGALAARHLMAAGASDLLFIDFYHGQWSIDRFEGARMEAIYSGHGDSVVRRYPEQRYDGTVVASGQCTEVAKDLLRDAFRKGMVRSGVICANDLIGTALCDVAEEFGQRLGEDFLLVGFDNLPESMKRGMSSLRPPLTQIGSEAARMMLESLSPSGATGSVRVCLHSRLMPRGSSRCANDADQGAG